MGQPGIPISPTQFGMCHAGRESNLQGLLELVGQQRGGDSSPSPLSLSLPALAPAIWQRQGFLPAAPKEEPQ